MGIGMFDLGGWLRAAKCEMRDLGVGFGLCGVGYRM